MLAAGLKLKLACMCIANQAANRTQASRVSIAVIASYRCNHELRRNPDHELRRNPDHELRRNPDHELRRNLKESTGGARICTNGVCAGTVRVFRQKFTLADAIGSHACSLEANMRVTNGFPLGSSLLLPGDTVNCVATLKAKETQEATRKAIMAKGIAEFQQIVSADLSPMLLQWKGIEARCAHFRQKFTPEDAIEFHAFAPLEALPSM
jgi:hypothetical protein